MTYLASRIRAISLDPSPERIAELARLALMVDRMERTLDEMVSYAMSDAAVIASDIKVIPIACGISRRFS